MMNGINDELILAARLLLATLFLIFGWRKLRDFPGTVNQMAQLGVPTPLTAAAVATFMELPVAFAVAIGAFTRPAAVLMFFLHAGNRAYRTSLLDNDGYGSSSTVWIERSSRCADAGGRPADTEEIMVAATSLTAAAASIVGHRVQTASLESTSATTTYHRMTS